MFRSFILISIAIVASGCAAAGKNFTEHQSLLNKVGENQSRIYVYRTGESALYSGGSAIVKIDNVEKGKCNYKGFNVFDVPSGNYQLQVNAWGMHGTCTIATNFDPQSEHYFEIKPRLTNYVKILGFFHSATPWQSATRIAYSSWSNWFGSFGNRYLWSVLNRGSGIKLSFRKNKNIKPNTVARPTPSWEYWDGPSSMQQPQRSIGLRLRRLPWSI